ncbi:MAG TPA: host attachment protein [Puia sp.]|jgi:protein required for attachment to host cells|nr:host attachment protein [Puia sp.]
MTSTWILVANSVYAKILEVTSPKSEAMTIEEFFHPKANKTVIRDFLEQQQKLTNKHPMMPSTAFGDNIDAHERKVFAKELADFLAVSYDQNKYKKLVVVSSRAFLGDLRNAFNENIKKHLAHELDKDLIPLALKNDELISKICNDLGLIHL